ncbi:hypothetical protein RHMOL_Rhmol12G0098500 [Rhododendron molle]|uniref:Uncharacterized protein n=1 Tax=Rhododendron molle TaxID=49168 RepID=A0ACC0LGT8_RHOML|nr:hypothetical protein RHMOL_Rhmol12G0098500 [Rhododendron molle]
MMDEQTPGVESNFNGDADNHNDFEDRIPHLGLEFNSDDDAFSFYNNYAFTMGFSVRREFSNRNKKTGEVTSRKYVCCKEGFRAPDQRDYKTKIPRAETRTGCNAHMSIRLDREKAKYVVYSFNATHNHDLQNEKIAHMLPSHRNISAAQAYEVDLADDSGIRLKSAHEFIGRQAGGMGNLGYTQQDHKNYLRSKRQTDLEYGEAGAILDYFEKQTLENPSFYYAMQLDVEEKITNIFWADAKMIIDYGHFGDVLSFDTTYRTNKEYRPLAVFTRFNHHREKIIFGAALLYDETAASFEWLFNTFFTAMSSKRPKTIFTDQDAVMAKAIPLVMPETYHRICTWHMAYEAECNETFWIFV